MNYCPCCSGLLLQHLHGSETYWFCRRCWQEMPVFSCNMSSSFAKKIEKQLAGSVQNKKNNNNIFYTNREKAITTRIELQDLAAS